MSEMVEKVARAIFNNTGGDADEMIARNGALPKWVYDAARDAIEAMRRPTVGMLLARDGASKIADMWPAMIDAALR